MFKWDMPLDKSKELKESADLSLMRLGRVYRQCTHNGNV